jgi:hypothetical protein
MCCGIAAKSSILPTLIWLLASRLDKSDPRNHTKHDDQFPLRVFRGSFLLPHEIESIVLHLTVKWINRSTHSAASF